MDGLFSPVATWMLRRDGLIGAGQATEASKEGGKSKSKPSAHVFAKPSFGKHLP